ncbi:MAG TPA: hypothetical protein VIC58_08905 [Actinomycetota bacterium]
MADTPDGPRHTPPVGAEYLPLIAALMQIDAPIVLFGGFAEDAMLGGSIRRPHDDVDILIERSMFPRGLEIFDELGFETPEVRWEPVPNEPLVVGTLRDDGLNLELSVFEVSDGTRSFTLPDAAGHLFRVAMPPDMLSAPPFMLEEIEVRTVSPLAQYQIREGLGILGPLGPMRPKDVASQAALRDRFFATRSEEELKPSIEPR